MTSKTIKVFVDNERALSSLDDAKFGILIRYLLSKYAGTTYNCANIPCDVQLALEFIMPEIDANLEKLRITREHRSKAGKRGAQIKRENQNSNKNGGAT